MLSAVVIAREDEERIERSVRAVVEQELDVPFEVVVVVSGEDRTARIVREQFPGVSLIELDRPELPGGARNAGLRVARGELITFPGSHVVLEPGSLQARVRAHEQGYGMVTCSVRNGNRTRPGWASYFLDHTISLPGRPSAPLDGPPTHASYVREPLLAIGGFPEDMRAGEDTVVNNELWARGHRAYRAQDVAFTYASLAVTPRAMARHHFNRGKALGRIFLDGATTGRRMLRSRFVRAYSPLWILRRVRRLAADVEAFASEEERAAFRDSRRLVMLGAAAAWAGLWSELLRRRPGRLDLLLRNAPPTRVLVVRDAGRRVLRVGYVRADRRGRALRVVELPLAFLPVRDALDDGPDAIADALEGVLGHPLGGLLLLDLDADDAELAVAPLIAAAELMVRRAPPARACHELGWPWLRPGIDVGEVVAFSPAGLRRRLLRLLALDPRRDPGGRLDGAPLPAGLSVYDFESPDGASVPLAARPALARLCRELIEPLAQRFGAAEVLSGYRRTSANERAGGAPFSHHIYDLYPEEPAVDLRFARGTPADWAQAATELGAGGVGRHDGARRVHIDQRAQRARWQGD